MHPAVQTVLLLASGPTVPRCGTRMGHELDRGGVCAPRGWALVFAPHEQSIRRICAMSHTDYPTMQGPAVYRIRVLGRLDPQWTDRLEGMEIHNLIRDDGRTETVLEGRLMDQSALAGVLAALHNLRLPVISADCLASLADDDDRDPEIDAGLTPVESP